MKLLIYFSPVPINSPEQRPHHFVSWWHETFKGEVIWIEPYPTRLPAWKDLDRIFHTKEPNSLGPEWMHAKWLKIIKHRFLPFEPFQIGRKINKSKYTSIINELNSNIKNKDLLVAIGKPSELAYNFCMDSKVRKVLYDVMDFMHLFSFGASSKWMLNLHYKILERSNICWTSSTGIQQALQKQTDKSIILVPNASTMPSINFSGTKKSKNHKSKVVFGFIGTIAPWIDWELLIKLSHWFQDCEIKLIGPIETKLPVLPSNIHILPPIAQSNVYDVMQSFDVGIIPFVVSDLTSGVDPIKYYEYRAAGLRVLSSRFGSMTCRDETNQVWFWDYDSIKELLGCLSFPINDADIFLNTNNWFYRFNNAAYSLS